MNSALFPFGHSGLPKTLRNRGVLVISGQLAETIGEGVNTGDGTLAPGPMPVEGSATISRALVLPTCFLAILQSILFVIYLTQLFDKYLLEVTRVLPPVTFGQPTIAIARSPE